MIKINNGSLEAVHTDDLKNIKGITLIGLVVTIIILLILSGVLIATLTGNGLFEKAKLAKEKQENAQEIEDIALKNYENNIDEYLYNSRENNSYELLASFTQNEEKDINNIKNYKEFEIVIGYNKIYVDSNRYNVSLYSTDYTYCASYYAGVIRTGNISFLSETKVKASMSNITSMKLYGIK